MAEGRSATLLFQLQKRGFNVTGSNPTDLYDEGDGYITLRVPMPWMIALKLQRFCHTLGKLFVSRLFPSSMATFFTVQLGVVLTTVFAESDSWLRSGWLADLLWNIDLMLNPLKHRMSISARVAYLASTASLLGFFMIVAVERFLLRVLLSFGPQFIRLLRGPMNGTWSAKQVIAMWKYAIHNFLLIKAGQENNTAAVQLCLPLQPVPWLHQTVNRFLNSVEPVLPTQEYARVAALAQEFLRKEGGKLNAYLILRSLICNNYCTPWFERYVYLGARTGLQANSNYYMMDCEQLSPVKDQVFRAANLCHHICQFSLQTSLGMPTTLIHQGTIPLCMKQYDRMFGTCRIAKREIDTLKTNRNADYIVVLRKGRYYKLDVMRRGEDEDRFLSPAEFAHQLRLICEHATMEAKLRHANSEADVSALTSLPRTQWAELRDVHFGDGVNRKSLLAIENALFVCNLCAAEGNNTLERARFLFHGGGAGDASQVWFDKSFNLVVFENGLAGLNCEISYADAPALAHMWEYALLSELIDFENSCDASALAGESLCGLPLPMPNLLEFSISASLAQEIKSAKQKSQQRCANSQLEILHCSWLGRENIKQVLGLAPDAFVQLCLVYTTYLDFNHKLSLAYESCHLRMFREGRTEAIRSLTKQARDFIEYMADGGGREDRAHAQELCRAACAAHNSLSLDSCIGKGVDSHLFALNVAAKGLDVKSEFLDYLHNKLTWSISSSQQPQHQTRGLREQLTKETANAFVSTGGGYAPISATGYGVAYTITPHDMYFHITCENSTQTNAKRFRNTLERVLGQMEQLMRSAGGEKVTMS